MTPSSCRHIRANVERVGLEIFLLRKYTMWLRQFLHEMEFAHILRQSKVKIKICQASYGGFVRKSVASMLGGKKPVTTAPAFKKVGPVKTTAGKKAAGPSQNKQVALEYVEPAKMTLKEICDIEVRFSALSIEFVDVQDNERAQESKSSYVVATRNATIKLIGALHKFVGPNIKAFLSDVFHNLLPTDIYSLVVDALEPSVKDELTQLEDIPENLTKKPDVATLLTVVSKLDMAATYWRFLSDDVEDRNTGRSKKRRRRVRKSFFKGDCSSSNELVRSWCVASEDFEGATVFDDGYEEAPLFDDDQFLEGRNRCRFMITDINDVIVRSENMEDDCSCIDKVVSQEQSAFISGRQILDRPIVLIELMVWYKKKKKKKLMLFKVDFKKAFDTVSCKYLNHMLSSLGFGSKRRGWIQVSLHSARSSVSSPSSEFLIKRGLRQGDPLSPFLFIIVMEGLHIAMRNVVCSGLIRGDVIGTLIN
ncbi:RNA-directed DNA polymerase, eukaryota, reverse transcriptase zinc-binding domain protein [Tanacetum coccineum]